MEKNNTVKQAGGFIIQLMPFAEESVISKLEENLSKVDSVTAMFEAGNTPEQILNILLEGMDVEITDTMPAKFYCDCCKERVEKVIISIGKKDIQSMIAEGEDVEVNCQFCNSHYKFNVDELKELLKKATK